MKKSVCLIRWVVWSLAVIFYLYEYVLRVIPAVMVSELMQTFAVSASGLGLLTAFYLYAYAPMQLPVGMLMDRFGARRLLTFAAFICAAGSIMFGVSHSLNIASFGRLLMGAGSAFAFVGVVYVCSHWFEAKRLALLVGLANSLGMLGAASGQGPLSYVVDHIGWRQMWIYLGIFGLLLAVIIYFAIKKEPKSAPAGQVAHESTNGILRKLKIVSSNPQSWINSVIALLFYATTVAFAGLWAVPFLMRVYGLPKEVAGFASSMIFIGWIVGGPLIGHFSDHIGKRKPMLLMFALICLGAMVGILLFNSMPVWLLYTLLFSVGFCQSAELLCYCLAVELNPPEAKGTAIALTNFMVFLAGALIQPIVGYFLDLGWTGQMLNNERIYSATDYKVAMIVFPATLLLSVIMTFFLKEKRLHRAAETQY